MDATSSIGDKAARNTVKRSVWEMHMGGAAVQQAPCPLCGEQMIAQNQNNGFDMAHIVARKYAGEVYNIFYRIPSCKVCNSNCEDICVFDYLWCRNRLAALRKLITVIGNAFISLHAHELAPEDKMYWRVLEHLYGPSRFPVAGGIQNTKSIYEIARVEQQAALVQESAALLKRQQELVIQMRAVMESEIRTMKFTGF